MPTLPSFRRACLLLALLAAPLLAGRAAEPVELDPGLSYLRVPDLAGPDPALAAALAGDRALVLDLRHSQASPAGAAALATALAARSARTPLLILVAPGTPPALAAALDRLPPGALTLGVRDAAPAPRLVVAQADEADRRAAAALDAGTSPAALLSGKVEKEGFDEASLVREFSDGRRNPRPPAATATPPAGTAAPQVDRVLQRAAHLHRALGAVRPRA